MAKINNQESFDGIPVTVYAGRFTGEFEIGEEVGEQLRMDDVAAFLVMGAVSKVGMGTTKDGDLKRTNTFEILNVLPVDAQAAKVFFEAGGAIAPKQAAEIFAKAAAEQEEEEEEELDVLFGNINPLSFDDEDDAL